MQLLVLDMMQNSLELAEEVRYVVLLVVMSGMPNPDKTDDAPPTEDEIPWAAIYDKAREIMHMTDNEFWTTSPRKFFALLDEALIFHGIKKRPEPVQFMDDIF